MAFEDILSILLPRKKDIKSIILNKVGLEMHTDSFSLFKVLTTATIFSKACLSIELVCNESTYKKVSLTALSFYALNIT